MRISIQLSRRKKIATTLLFVMALDALMPLTAVALTGGPSQPEVQSFEPVGTSQMVDAFSGDFNYNIPLLDVNGYPINIAYHAGVSADQEASWVGLGWNINPGTINRAMNGLPDDMNGEDITHVTSLKDNWTLGLSADFGFEVFGKEARKKFGKEGLNKFRTGNDSLSSKGSLTFNLGLKYNSYKGLSQSMGASNSIKIAEDLGLNAGLGLGYSDEGGLDITPSISMSSLLDENIDEGSARQMNFKVGGAFNSRAGMKGLNFGSSQTLTLSNDKSGTRKTGKGSFGLAQGMFSFGTPTYSPGISTPYSGYSIDFNFNTGMEFIGIEGEMTFSGSYSNQYIAKSDTSITKKGYGYLYEQEATQSTNQSERDYILDYQRQNELPLMETTPYLPWAKHTHDMYAVSAQGVGGTYRLYRNEIGVFHDDYRQSKNNGYRAGVEVGSGNLAKGGANTGYNHMGSKSGVWTDYNSLLPMIGAVNNQASSDNFNSESNHTYASNVDYEPAYFREVNELLPSNEGFISKIGDEHTVYPLVFPKLSLNENEVPQFAKVLGSLHRKNGGPLDISTSKADNIGQERAQRNKLLTYFTASDSLYCLTRGIQNFTVNASYPMSATSLPRESTSTSQIRKSSHISEVTIVNTDGSRHVFGIPAYNRHQEEMSFRVAEASASDAALGLVNYTATDASVNNQQQIDRFFTKKTTPSHAHSYLITGVLSPDYVDLTGDGISDDDLGSSVKFNYTRTNNAFRWRVPYRQGKAKYNPGRHSDNTDGTGSVVYGEKEVWYVHSIEGKTHIALFKISKRDDALGVVNSLGGRDTTQRMYKLDSIQLFSKRDLLVNGSNATPIKTVHFEYDYQLCPGVPNQIDTTKGKLTLTKIYFTYGNSYKGKLNAYKFTYEGLNPSYHLNGYDMWGNYHPSTDSPTNAEYPYTNQTKDSIDQYASAWNLTKIELPSGGQIQVQYESDDYGYVQDKRAMSMYKVQSFSTSEGISDVSKRHTALYGEGSNKEQYDYMYFDLKERITASNAAEILRKEYFEDIEDLQVTIYTKINRQDDDNYEYIKTYCKPAHVEVQDNVWEVDCGVTDDGYTGYVRIEKQHLRDKNKGEKINPLALSAFQFTRMNLNYLIQRGGNSKQANQNGRISFPIVGTFIGMLGDVANMAAGPNRMLMVRKFCREFEPDRSWVRLNVPDKVKYGGGHRVKQIVMNDMWSDINEEDATVESATYGQQYEYTIEEESTSNSFTTISSGVATNEPMVGRDENPFVQPHAFDQKRPGVPDARYTFEHPIASIHFPGASVGYRKVKVSSIEHDGQNENHRTGYQVSEFYTAKDYPVQIEFTDLADNSLFLKPRLSLSSIFKLGAQFELATAGQGYTIILNDMHGKPSKSESYNEHNQLISGAKYEYQTDEYGNLDNSALVIQPDGTIESKTLGVHAELSMDFQQKTDEVFSADADFNLDAFAVGLPLIIPTLFPKVNFSQTNVYTAVATKVVRKIGLLKRTTAYKEGSEIHTDNLLYDGQTGQVLLTSVGNEFNDNVYNFTYPAHWAYDRGMGQAFKNWGLEISGMTVFGGTIHHSTLNLEEYLFPGDKCLLMCARHPEKIVYVTENRKTTSDLTDLCLVDEQGNLITHFRSFGSSDEASIRVLRSGRRNMASVSIGSVTSLTNPLEDLGGGSYTLSFDDVLATSAVEYKDQWRSELEFTPQYICDSVPSDFYQSVISTLNTCIDDSLFYSRLFYREIDDCYGTYDVSLAGEYSAQEVYDSIQIFKGYQTDLLDLYGNYSTQNYDWSLDTNTLDTLALTYWCGYTTPGFYRYVSSSYTASSYLGYGSDLWQELVLGDTLYVYDSLVSAYMGVADWKLFETHKSKVNKYNKDNTTLSNPAISGATKTGLMGYYPGFDSTTHEVSTSLSIDGYRKWQVGIKLTDTTTDIQLENCRVTIETPDSLIQNIEEILDDTIVDDFGALVRAKVSTYEGTIDTVTLSITSSCGPFLDCEYVCGNYLVSEKVNPYREGLLGNWRPFRSWTYVDDREYDQSQPNPRTDGTIDQFKPFWQDQGDNFAANTTNEEWVWTSEVTEYSPYGMELENVDPLGRYSAARYGYAQTLPTAVGSNMRYRQMWYEGFEQYQYLVDIQDNYLCPQYEEYYTVPNDSILAGATRVDQDFSHSGNISLRLSPSDSLVQEIDLSPTFDSSAIVQWKDSLTYYTRANDQITPFRPTTGKYLLSAWVHQDGSFNDTLYDETVVVVEFEDSVGGITRYKFQPSGIIINGWQRIETSFTVPSNPSIMRVKYKTGTYHGWFDDVRIHPYEGNMKSYAYDFRTLRLMAELDENNYATFYEYDLEGNLVRVKKETVKGIKSLQENRQHQRISN